MFKMDDAFLVNIKDGRAMDVSGNIDAENRNMIIHKKHGGLNQQWDVVYADEWTGEPKKGELKTSVSMLREISTLSLQWTNTDTLT